MPQPHPGRPESILLALRLLPEYVVDKEIDLVVAGTRGRGAITTMLLGSVAKEVLATVPCDILVVREAKSALQTPGA